MTLNKNPWGDDAKQCACGCCKYRHQNMKGPCSSCHCPGFMTMHQLLVLPPPERIMLNPIQ